MKDFERMDLALTISFFWRSNRASEDLKIENKVRQERYNSCLVPIRGLHFFEWISFVRRFTAEESRHSDVHDA